MLSSEYCEKGLECKNADCSKGHPSPAAVNGKCHNSYHICSIMLTLLILHDRGTRTAAGSSSSKNECSCRRRPLQVWSWVYTTGVYIRAPSEEWEAV